MRICPHYYETYRDLIAVIELAADRPESGGGLFDDEIVIPEPAHTNAVQPDSHPFDFDLQRSSHRQEEFFPCGENFLHVDFSPDFVVHDVFPPQAFANL